MQIRTIGQGPHPDIAIAGSTVTVAGVEIDTAERQDESQQIIDIRLDGGIVSEGGSGYQLASIVIPPRRYEEIVSEAGEGEESPESQEEAAESRIAVPLDPRHVAVTIWPTV
jgi:hypothetical protein